MGPRTPPSPSGVALPGLAPGLGATLRRRCLGAIARKRDREKQRDRQRQRREKKRREEERRREEEKKEGEEKGEKEALGRAQEGARGRRGLGRAQQQREGARLLSPTRAARAYLPDNSWRTRTAPSWICSPPASGRSPTFSRASDVGGQSPSPGSVCGPGSGPARPARPPGRSRPRQAALTAAPRTRARARPWPRPRLRLSRTRLLTKGPERAPARPAPAPPPPAP